MANLSEEVGLIIFISAFLLLVAIGIIALVVVYQKKQTQYIHEKKQLKAAFEKEMLEAQLEMQEQTLKHISQEIHDNIGQTLSLAKLNLTTINFKNQNGIPDKIANAKELVTKAIADLRILSKTLHTETILAAGLLKAIEMELSLITKTAVFKTHFSTTGTPALIDPQKELILFRTVQEALNNAIKHSGASLIQVTLIYDSAYMQVRVMDNGKGFNRALEEASVEKGSGLRNMQSRVNMIGGNLVMEAMFPGTNIQITLPTNN